MIGWSQEVAAITLLFVLLSACEPAQLYLANHTVIGINAKVNPEQGNGILVIGYDRTFATVIPRSVEHQENGLVTRDAMSALVCSNLVVDGITIRRYTESLATGKAAKMFADNLGGQNHAVAAAKIKDFFDCFKQQTNPAGGNP
ncbi:MAG TPA: hypothetical protein VKG22_02200 [Stellaceae bacterium]|nr:hypothetical protein [Stellaceae bacterium]